MDKIKEIESLLVEFYNGNTTIEQEKRLQKYFCELPYIPDNLKADKELIDNLRFTECTTEFPQDLESKLSSKIDQWASKDKKIIHGIRWKWATGIAASIAIIIISLTTILVSENSEKDMTEKYSQAQIDANYMEAQKALIMVSQNLNRAEKINRKATEAICMTQEEIKNKH